MNTSNFTYLLANPQKITSEDMAALDLIIKKYPYFQSARALQLKGLKNQESFLYNDALKLTAAHTTDRDILFEYITSEKFIQNEISQTILQHDASVGEIKVVAEDVSEQISLEIDRQLKAEMQKAEDILNPELFQRKVASVSNLVENKEEKPEDILQPDKPLEFTKNDTHSFSEWLKLTKAKPIERSEETSKEESEKSIKEDEKERKFELIDKFIQENPKIIPSEIENKSQKEEKNNLAKPYTQATDSLMTETLAKVYLQQKNYKKAIQAYKILILKNPEKSGFFADQIRAIEKLINSEQS
ncbi:hypothetical protein LS48_13665 [Aequorivita aquimaris]|uniref:Tetratricopeptide repeat protein n=1 Tax=Aequorivita aquimaris TaxID=1548749 RepID=A0A137REV8_9FLAO|nr:hypothetical protein [Aequorivita aquimaris]KXN98029.1 hypothetical protein LS48_13665 [Aequorivita aquimaris]MDX1783070.1 hypothetical protein [Aequorivita vladivostokensis]